MRNLLAFLAAATLTILGVGWYLGWFRTVNIELNTTKIKEDLNKGSQKVQQLLERNRKERAEGQTPGSEKASEKPRRGTDEEPVMIEGQFKTHSPKQQ